MKKRNLFIVSILCLLFSFAQAQSPQVANFIAGLSGFNSSFAVHKNAIWTSNGISLTKTNMQTGMQTLYKPENSNIHGNYLSGLKVDTANNLIYGGGLNMGIFTFDDTLFRYYNTTTTNDTVYAAANFEIDNNHNVYFLSSFINNSIINENDIVKFDGDSLRRLNCPVSPTSYSTKNNFVVLNNGYIYCRSQTNKIYRFNGNQWDSLNAPVANYYGNFICDNQQQLWLVPLGFQANTSAYHLYKLNGNNWIDVPVTFNSPVSTQVNEVICDNNNTFWFICVDNIIKRMGNSFYTLNNLPTFNFNNYNNGYLGFYIDANGDYWTSYQNTDFEHTTNKILHYSSFSSIWQDIDLYTDLDNWVDYTLVDKWNRKWALASNSLYQLNGNTWTKITLPPMYSHIRNYYKAPKFDSNGNLWCILTDTATNYSAVHKYNGSNWTLIAMGAEDVAIDSLGHYFIVDGMEITHFDGIATYNWQPNDPLGSFPINIYGYVNSCIYWRNNYWFLTDQGEFFKFDGNNFTMVMGFNAGGSFNHLLIDVADNLWIGIDNKWLYRFDNTNFTDYSFDALPFGNANFRVIGGTTDLQGNTWLGTNRGLAKFDGASWLFYNANNSDFSSISRALSVDNSNNLWFSGGSGICVFNEDGIANNYTQTVQPYFKGKVYYDNNANGYQNLNDFGVSNQKIFSLPDSVIFLSNNLGNYQIASQTAPFTISPLLFPNWQQTSIPTIYNIPSNLQSIDSLDFGLKLTTNTDSLDVHIWGSDSRCNWYNTYFISYQNKGSSVLSGNIIFTMDSLETFVSTSPNADSLSPFVYSWHFQNLMPFQSQNISVTVQSPNWQAMGQTINGNVHAIGTNFNVTALYSDILTCAYDPNDKTSKPLGEHYLHQIKPDCPLEYLIRFQNTGNDVAFNIAVEDTISPYLDMNTFELLGASHFVETKYAQNGAVRFEFPLIMLPDSNQNEALSHGFVAYRIKPKANVPLPAVIENTAFIYFDQNPAVVTNTTRDTMTQFYTGINAPTPQSALLISPNPFDNQTIVTYPNPFGEGYEVLIYDLSGKLLMRKMDNTGRFSIEKGNLQSGMYLLKVRGKKEMSAKLVVE